MYMLTSGKKRGFLRADDGAPVGHGEAIAPLLDAIQLSTVITIIKWPAYQKSDTLVAKVNNLADVAAKQAAAGAIMGPILVVQDCGPLTSLSPNCRAIKTTFEKALKIDCGEAVCVNLCCCPHCCILQLGMCTVPTIAQGGCL